MLLNLLASPLSLTTVIKPSKNPNKPLQMQPSDTKFVALTPYLYSSKSVQPTERIRLRWQSVLWCTEVQQHYGSTEIDGTLEVRTQVWWSRSRNMLPEAKRATVQGRVQSGETLCEQCCIKMTDLNVLLTCPPDRGAHLNLLLPARIVRHVHGSY